MNSYSGLSPNQLIKIYRNKIEQLAFTREHRNYHKERNILTEMRSLEKAMGKNKK